MREGGGGGKTPKCTDTEEKNHVHVTYMLERAKRASASETLFIQVSKCLLHLYTYSSNAVPCYVLSLMV